MSERFSLDSILKSIDESVSTKTAAAASLENNTLRAPDVPSVSEIDSMIAKLASYEDNLGKTASEELLPSDSQPISIHEKLAEACILSSSLQMINDFSPLFDFVKSASEKGFSEEEALSFFVQHHGR